jgi:hypothetical protein
MICVIKSPTELDEPEIRGIRNLLQIEMSVCEEKTFINDMKSQRPVL